MYMILTEGYQFHSGLEQEGSGSGEEGSGSEGKGSGSEQEGPAIFLKGGNHSKSGSKPSNTRPLMGILIAIFVMMINAGPKPHNTRPVMAKLMAIFVLMITISTVTAQGMCQSKLYK